MGANDLRRGRGTSRIIYTLPVDMIRYNPIRTACFSIILFTRLVWFLFCFMEEVFPWNEVLISASRGLKTEAKFLLPKQVEDK